MMRQRKQKTSTMTYNLRCLYDDITKTKKTFYDDLKTKQKSFYNDIKLKKVSTIKKFYRPKIEKKKSTMT